MNYIYNKKKVLHIVGGMNIGGTETMLMNLYRNIHNEVQFDFISYYKDEGYYDKEIKELGGKIIRLDAPNKVGFIKAVNELKKVIKDNQYSAVHTHTLFNCGIGVLAGYLAKAPVRISHAHTTFDNSSSFIKKVYVFIMRSLIKIFSTDYLACSNSAGRYLFGERIVKNKKYKVIPNYIEYKKFINIEDKGSIRKELGIKDDDIVIGHVGRFMEAKNHEFLIDILNKLIKENNQIKGILVGDGVLKKDIEKKVKALNLEDNIYFLGLRNDVNKIVNDMDLFIMPSIYEGLGLVLLEAQAASVPCLVSEAIQPEADLGIGLLKKLKLSDDIGKWTEKANEMIKINKKDKEIIIKGFEDKGYKVEDIINKLYEVYCI